MNDAAATRSSTRQLVRNPDRASFDGGMPDVTLPQPLLATSILRPVIGVGEAAEIAGIHEQTVRDWIRQGLLPATRRVAAGSSRVRIKTADLLKLLGLEVAPPAPRRRSRGRRAQ